MIVPTKNSTFKVVKMAYLFEKTIFPNMLNYKTNDILTQLKLKLETNVKTWNQP